MLIKNPVAEDPVNIKNPLKILFISPFIVKNTNIMPNKEKMIGASKKRKEPLSNSLNAGMKNSLTITRKTPANAQNIVGIKNFFIALFYQKTASIERRFFYWLRLYEILEPIYSNPSLVKSSLNCWGLWK